MSPPIRTTVERAGPILLLILAFSAVLAPMGSGGVTPIPPNHVPHPFWGSPQAPITLSGVQGSGQLYNQDFVPTRSRPTTANNNLPCIGTPPTSCNQFYCTGMTGGPFVPVAGNDQIAVNTQFAYVDINVTVLPWEIQFVLFIGTAVPATTFQSGHCAVSVAEIGNYVLFAHDTSHANSGGMFVFTKQPAGTYYTWLEAEVQNEASGKASFPLGGNGPNLSMWDASLIKTPLVGSPSASSNLGNWPAFPSGTLPGPETPGEVPSSNGHELAATLQTQTTQVRLSVGIAVSFPAGQTCVNLLICTNPPNPPSAWVWIQYSTNGGTSWADICGDDANGLPLSFVDVTQTARAAPYTSGYCVIQATALGGNNLFRIVGAGGDDFTTPSFFFIDWDFLP